jgi:hypothetical protein
MDAYTLHAVYIGQTQSPPNLPDGFELNSAIRSPPPSDGAELERERGQSEVLPAIAALKDGSLVAEYARALGPLAYGRGQIYSELLRTERPVIEDYAHNALDSVVHGRKGSLVQVNRELSMLRYTYDASICDKINCLVRLIGAIQAIELGYYIEGTVCGSGRGGDRGEPNPITRGTYARDLRKELERIVSLDDLLNAQARVCDSRPGCD